MRAVLRTAFGAIFICLPVSLFGLSQAQAKSLGQVKSVGQVLPHHGGTSQRVARARFHRGTGRAQQERRYAGLAHRRHLSRSETVAAMRSMALAHEDAGPSVDRGAGGVVTVNTAAGLPITVASAAAPKFEGFIADLVASGYQPRQIHCLAHGGHVRDSNHYWGGACDIDQSGRGRTAGRMYHVADLARKWGLRDGCTFGDCGHVDVPRGNRSAQVATRSRRRGRTG
jgi:hypothetical protein